jgi:Fe-Mn family superoxide dismutase
MTLNTHKLMDLPYENNSLEPYITSETISYHYDKHHRTYVNNLNNLLDVMSPDSPLKHMKLNDIVLASHGKSDLIGIFNNAAQVLNHDFYWLSMKPHGGGMPDERLLDLINETFGGFQAFKQEFVKIGTSQFGSGWVWLVKDNKSGKLLITKTGNADNPILYDQTPLITCDVWEHAYYIDYRNRRAEYIEIFIDKLVNWNFALKNLS